MAKSQYLNKFPWKFSHYLPHYQAVTSIENGIDRSNGADSCFLWTIAHISGLAWYRKHYSAKEVFYKLTSNRDQWAWSWECHFCNFYVYALYDVPTCLLVQGGEWLPLLAFGGVCCFFFSPSLMNSLPCPYSPYWSSLLSFWGWRSVSDREGA